MTTAAEIEVPAIGELPAGNLTESLTALLGMVTEAAGKVDDINGLMDATLAAVQVEVQKSIDASHINDAFMNYISDQLSEIAIQGGFTITPWTGAKGEADPLV